MIDLSDDLGASLLATFSWDAHRDDWTWSDEGFLLHGYRPGEVTPTFDLAVQHKLPAGRARAERVLSRAATPGFRYSNHHRIVDATGRERVVLSAGSTSTAPASGGLPARPVMQGFMVDITAQSALAPVLAESDEAARLLSARERQVLLLLAGGHTNQEIADELFVSVNTIKTFLRTSYRKIGVSRRSQAALWTVANSARLRETS